MKTPIKNLLVCMLLLAASALQAQEEFSISTQIRSRAEYRNGSIFPRNQGDDPVFFVNTRARLSMEFKRSDLLMKFSGQHVGVWGQDPQIEKEGRFMLNEAWIQLPFGNGFFVKAGRQQLAYDDERILGTLDWNNSGRWHDALKIGYEGVRRSAHLLLAYNQKTEPYAGMDYFYTDAQPYRSMQGLWYKENFSKKLTASLLFLNLGLVTGNGTEPSIDLKYMQTLGTNLNFKTADWNLYGTFYYQFGKNQQKQHVQAWMWAAKADYKINDLWTITLASDYLSGDNHPSEGTSWAFNPLYGTHHRFYGAMDYYYASGFLSNMAPGLWDNQLGASFKANTAVTLQGNIHLFSTTTDPKERWLTSTLGKSMGSEMDLSFDWLIRKDVRLSGGYSVYFGTPTMEMYKGGSEDSWQDWGWVSLNVNPRVFISKW